MTMPTAREHEALRLAEKLETWKNLHPAMQDAAAELRRLHALTQTGGFPPRILALLRDVADRNPPAPFGPFEDDKGEPLQDDADAALAWIAGRSAQTGGWQPIETAPKDGTAVFAFWSAGPDEEPGMWQYAAAKVAKNRWWTVCDGERLESCVNPTHWMPLPPSPAAEADAEREVG